MSILIISLIVIVVVIIIVAVVMKSKKKKGGELMAQQPISEPQKQPLQPTQENVSSNIGDSDSNPQI